MFSIVTVDLVNDDFFHLGIDGSGSAVGHAGPESLQISVGIAGSAGLPADLLLRGVRPVNDRVDAAHKQHPVSDFLGDSLDIVGGKDSLPDINADLRHVFHNGFAERISVMHDDYMVGVEVVIQFPVRLFEEFSPGFRGEEEAGF